MSQVCDWPTLHLQDCTPETAATSDAMSPPSARSPKRCTRRDTGGIAGCDNALAGKYETVLKTGNARSIISPSAKGSEQTEDRVSPVFGQSLVEEEARHRLYEAVHTAQPQEAEHKQNFAADKAGDAGSTASVAQKTPQNTGHGLEGGQKFEGKRESGSEGPVEEILTLAISQGTMDKAQSCESPLENLHHMETEIEPPGLPANSPINLKYSGQRDPELEGLNASSFTEEQPEASAAENSSGQTLQGPLGFLTTLVSFKSQEWQPQVHFEPEVQFGETDVWQSDGPGGSLTEKSEHGKAKESEEDETAGRNYSLQGEGTLMSISKACCSTESKLPRVSSPISKSRKIARFEGQPALVFQEALSQLPCPNEDRAPAGQTSQDPTAEHDNSITRNIDNKLNTTNNSPETPSQAELLSDTSSTTRLEGFQGFGSLGSSLKGSGSYPLTETARRRAGNRQPRFAYGRKPESTQEQDAMGHKSLQSAEVLLKDMSQVHSAGKNKRNLYFHKVMIFCSAMSS